MAASNEYDSLTNSTRGRPRSSEVHTRILDSTLALLGEMSVDKVSIEMIAQRAGVGKSSIYRRWSNKEELIIDALERLKPDMGMPGEGQLQEVMYGLAHSFASNLNNPLGKQMLSLLISTLAGHSQIAESYWEKISLPKTQEIVQMIGSFRNQESFREDADLETAAELMVGYIMFQLLLKPPSTDMEHHLKNSIDIILNGIKSK